MVEMHYCDHCEEHEAQVTMRSAEGETRYLCTSPECMMSAGMCPSCSIELEIKVCDTGETLYSCPHCTFQQTYEELGQA